ncbi:hypothetical protein NEF87_002330 [Candidatus Lokiarchaeum ossiferum]|uniref:Amine oxidase domain-containing protein n=1 Tax=Candidatus Lokiarchaeum ossiferum TaxID=2951803 RepID=A0ABY6HRB2_9ARCH|nr:hypothetical protein NEF87_002330 [Candidatus Lokiarchaeum sp. B-35]
MENKKELKNTKKKKVVIIGAGVAGLASGIYAKKNGFDAEIYEAHSKPGGLCTSWKRGGYIFETMHWLVGTKKGNFWNKIFTEVGAFQNLEMKTYDEYIRYCFPDKDDIIFYTDIDKLHDHFMKIAPEDKKEINKFCKTVKKLVNFNYIPEKPRQQMNFLDNVKSAFKILPFLKILSSCMKISLNEYSKRFKNQQLRRAFKNIFLNDETSVFGFFYILAMFHKGTNGYPIGGSLEVIRNMEKTYLNLGGNINYNSPVKKILHNAGNVSSIVLENGKEIFGDFFISSGDLFVALESMLGIKSENSPYKDLFLEKNMCKPCFQVSLGVNHNFINKTNSVYRYLPLKETIKIAGHEFDILETHQNFGLPFAPKNRSNLVISYNHYSEFESWFEFAEDREKYSTQKKEILAITIKALEEHYPGISNNIETTDVATPKTFQRYTQSWNGTFNSWHPTPKNARSMMKQRPYQLREFQNLYFAGRYIFPPGGIPPSVKTGRDVLQLICKKEKKIFKAD